MHIFSEQAFTDMYAEIHVDILHFNEDTKSKVVLLLHVKIQKKTRSI